MIRALALCLTLFVLPAGASAVATRSSPATDTRWLGAVGKDIAAREFHASRNARGLQAPNRSQGFRTYFEPRGIVVVDRSEDQQVMTELHLSAWGRAGDLRAAGDGVVAAEAQRVEIRRQGITEWFENRPEGLEQGFDVAQRIAGEGALRLQLSAPGAALSMTSAGIILQRGAHQLRYQGLKAWDADGLVLASKMAVVDNRIELRVDDRSARYPITIDPILTNVPDAQLESNQTSGQLGHSVTYAGDLNGDGFGDIALGAFGFDGGATNSGAVFIYFGSAGAFNTTPDGQLTLSTADARLGGSVAAAGDVNGDGFGDLVVGASAYANGQANEGAAFVYLGAAGASFDATADGVLENNQVGAFMGGSVAGAGDVNGDGYADVIVGAAAWDNSANGNEGRAFIYFGGAGASFNTTPDVQPFSSLINAAYGSSVAGGGDINGDGFADVVIGAVLYDDGQLDEGNVFVYFGSAAFDIGVDGALQSNQAGAQLGGSVAIVGDVNGDGYADVLAGAAAYSNGEAGEGAAMLWLGGAGGSMNTTVDAVLEVNQAGANLGRSVGGAGDVNGDGFADVLVGAELFDASVANEGAAFLYLGGAGVFDTTFDNQLVMAQAGSRFGFSVSGGDVNRDGYADVLVGAPSFNGGLAEEGAGFFYFGGARGLDSIADGSVSSAQGSGQAGHSVATGDVNGDGYADLIVGALGYDQGGGFTNAGTVFIYFGSAGSFNTVADAQLQLSPGQTNARFGTSVAAGDLNGDGFDDVVVGAREWDGGQVDEGAAFVYYGGAGAFNSVADVQLESNQIGAQFGWTAAVIGDANGDGFNDLAIGAIYFDNGNTDEGAVFVYFGGTALDTVADGQLEVGQNAAYLGASVAGAGDVNGDGFADLVAGGTGFDGSGTNSGIAQIFFGGAGTAFNSIADATLPSTPGARLGSSAVSAGDMNGDGYADVLVGAYESTNGQSMEGAAFLYLGGAGAFNIVADATFEFNQADAGVGSSVAGGGDINGDGFADVVVGAHLFDDGESDEGGAFVYFGGSTVDNVVDAILQPNQIATRMGFAAAMGDFNGDGFADIVVGAPSLDDTVADDGAALLYMGNGSGRTVAADQYDDYLLSLSPWGLSRLVNGYRAGLDISSPRGRERAQVEVESCPITRAFGSPQCTRTLSASWVDIGVTGITLTTPLTGFAPESVHHWRARALYAPTTVTAPGIVAPLLPAVGPWRRMDANAGVADVRVSDALFGNGFE